MEDKTFLTEKRRSVLIGEFDGSDSSERTHKSLIRTRARTAIRELIEVARSDQIDNADVFEPNDLARLIDALMVPDDGLTPRWNFEDDPQEYRDTYRYQLALHGRLSHALDGYGDMLHRDYPPGESPPSGEFNINPDESTDS